MSHSGGDSIASSLKELVGKSSKNSDLDVVVSQISNALVLNAEPSSSADKSAQAALAAALTSLAQQPPLNSQESVTTFLTDTFNVDAAVAHALATPLSKHAADVKGALAAHDSFGTLPKLKGVQWRMRQRASGSAGGTRSSPDAPPPPPVYDVTWHIAPSAAQAANGDAATRRVALELTVEEMTQLAAQLRAAARAAQAV